MSKVYADKIEPRNSNADVTIGASGQTVTLAGNDLRSNTVKDSGGNSLWTSDGSGNITLGASAFQSNLRLIQYTHSTGGLAPSALALASDKVSTALTATVARGGDTTAQTVGTHAADATALTVDNFAEKFRPGDYIFFDLGTDDVARVVATNRTTGLTIERGVLGYTAQSISATDVWMYAGSHLHNKGTEDDSGVNIRTDKQGRFKGMLFGDSGIVPRGSTEGTSSRGIVPGSGVIQFPLHGGYQNLGVSVGSADSTGLGLGATYKFKITDSLGTTGDITFITDSADVSWGKVIELINQEFIDNN